MPSLRHRTLALVIGRLRNAREVDDPEQVRSEVLAGRAGTDPAPSPRLVRGCTVTRSDDLGFPVFSLTVDGTAPVRTVLYLHGGGYVAEIDRFHWLFVARLARRTGVRVVVPAYPLAPEHTWRAAHEPLLHLAETVAIESPHGVTLMGDSAGGGLALALAQQLARRPGPQPTGLVLLSPWVDLTGTTPGTDEASARDPWLKRTKIDLYAQWWAGEDDPARPEVSPLHGELNALPPTLVLCGTLDTLWPQSTALVHKATAAGVPVTYHEERDLLHVYPILPVPEARTAMEQVVAWLR
ncbi:MAG: alpha/beta hydrolase fold domain-containing protein [Nocardioides sp.]